MTHETLTLHGLIGVGPSTLRSLREALERTLGDQAAPLLQEVGYASGAEVYSAFRGWLDRRAGVGEPADLDTIYLAGFLADFFADLGWGRISVEQLGTAALVLDTTDWAEVTPGAAAHVPACHYTTGMLAAFLTELAGEVFSVMQVEGMMSGDGRCRFLAGSPATLQQVFEAMTRGEDYAGVLSSTAPM